MDAAFTIWPDAGSSAGLAVAVAVTLLAGLVKGMTGFAMPMVMISGLSLFLPPDVALAALILPTCVANLMQALRQGWRAARDAVVRFRLYLVALIAAMVVSAQLVAVLSPAALYLIIGGPVVVFGLLQLAGWRPVLGTRVPALEAGVGGFAGLVGGVSGVWGPPTVLYLTAIDLPKAEHVRVQGVIYAIGAVVLVVAHLGSGVLRAETIPLSVWLIVPAILGQLVGQQILDRIDQAAFRRVILAVLVIAGLNLIRRGLMG